MSVLDKYPICTGDIEIEVPEGVGPILTVTTFKGETLVVPVRNRVCKVDHDVAEKLLSIPGYSKVQLIVNTTASIPSAPSQPAAPTAPAAPSQPALPTEELPSREAMMEFLKGKEIPFRGNISNRDLEKLFKDTKKAQVEAAQQAPVGSEGEGQKIDPLTEETYPNFNLEGLTKVLPDVTDLALIQKLISLEVNGDAREDFVAALEAREAEIWAQ